MAGFGTGVDGSEKKEQRQVDLCALQIYIQDCKKYAVHLAKDEVYESNNQSKPLLLIARNLAP